MPHAQLPTEVYCAADVRQMDQTAIHNYGVPGITLMERAGAATLAAIRERWPGVRTLSAVCGSGNNGGDAYIVARLAHELGWDVRAYPASPVDALQGDARLAHERYRAAGGAILAYMPEDFEAAEILIDGLLGSGLDRDITGPYAGIIAAMNRYRQRGLTHRSNQRRIVALDLPSGLQADTGTTMGCAVKADLTVCFVGLKGGLFTADGPELAGEVVFADLGIDPAVRLPVRPKARLLTVPCPALPARTRAAHKGLYGHVLVVGGDEGYSGAARLAAEAAARVGAGLVSIATRRGHAALMNQGRPELMCHGVETAAELEPLLARASVVAIGPGLGQGEWGQARLTQVLDCGKPLIVDADALNLLARSGTGPREDWVLTPHPGEAARLLGISSADVQRDRYTAVETLQQRYGGVVVLKGSGTLIKAGSVPPDICTAGNPGMASGGMGDVLTGVIAGLAAQRIDLAEASRLGVCLHARAGDIAAEAGERGLLAGDLMGALRRLVN